MVRWTIIISLRGLAYEPRSATSTCDDPRVMYVHTYVIYVYLRLQYYYAIVSRVHYALSLCAVYNTHEAEYSVFSSLLK